MAKSTITLPNGTIITIEGEVDEIKKIASLYSEKEKTPINQVKKSKIKVQSNKQSSDDILLEIVKYIKDCDEADLIEKNILDRSSQVDRVLLPIYIANKLQGKPKLTSGDIAGVLKELGIKMATQNISITLRGTASKYVMPDRRVKQGVASKYDISRPGIKYFSEVLQKQKND